MILHADTLVYDTARIVSYQANANYYYNRELVTPEIDLFGILSREIERILSKMFGSWFAEEYSEILSELFTKPGKHRHTPAYPLQEETIYGVDFSKEIAAGFSGIV